MPIDEHQQPSVPLKSSNGQFLPSHQRPNKTNDYSMTVPAITMTPAIGTAPGRLMQLLSDHPGFLFLAAVYRAIRKRPLVGLFGAIFLGGLAFGLVWYLFPPSTFIARALVHFDLAPTGFIDSPQNQYYASNPGSFQKTQVALIRSQPILSAALKRPEVRSLSLLRQQRDPIAYLEREIAADFTASPEILRVTMSDQDPIACRTIVNAVINTYIQEVVSKERSQIEAEWLRVQALIASYDDAIRSKRNQLRQLEEQTGLDQSYSFELLFRSYIEQLERSRKELAIQQALHRQCDAELNTLISRLALARILSQLENIMPWYARLAFEECVAILVSPSQVELALQQEPIIQEKIREVQKCEAELQSVEMLLSPNIVAEARTNILQSKRNALLQAKAQLLTVTNNLRPSVIRRLLHEFISQTELKITELQDKRDVAKHLESHLQEQIKHLDIALSSFQKNRLDFQTLRDDIDAQTQVYKKLIARKNQLEMLRTSPPRVTLLEEAVVLPVYGSKKRWLYTGLATSSAIFSWLIILLIWESRTQYVYGSDELIGVAQNPLVVTLPYVRRVPKLSSYTETPCPDNDRKRSEQYIACVDSFRASLLLTFQSQPHQVFLITSAIAGEGKTTVSVHLAASMARTGKRVLLIDADLLHGKAHRFVNRPQSPGLVDIICGELSWQKAVHHDLVPHLDFIPAGACSSSCVYALNQSSLLDLIRQLRSFYDVIIIDCSPISLVPDCLNLASQVDGVVLCAMRQVSTLPLIRLVSQQLTNASAHLYCLVISGMPNSTRRFYKRSQTTPDQPNAFFWRLRSKRRDHTEVVC